MKKIWKKNQVIITALAIMIAVAGYLNFTSDKQVLNTSVENMESEGASGNKDDSTVSASVTDSANPDELALGDTYDDTSFDGCADVAVSEDATENDVENTDMAEASLDENGDPIDSDTVGEAVLTSGSVTLSQAKLSREQTRSKAKEMLLEIINNDSLSEDAKKDAVAKMLSMTERMEKETAAENQLAAKGFADAVVNISDESVDVSVPVAELTDKQRTQIEDIITRNTGYELTKIVITTMQAD
ncbi:MAG: SpoIIIAH-like family protein [Lachnospiraceae bacterium]|nr:SpoIIIAH-like family protein [Lachnospiraceae bacterium]